MDTPDGVLLAKSVPSIFKCILVSCKLTKMRTIVSSQGWSGCGFYCNACGRADDLISPRHTVFPRVSVGLSPLVTGVVEAKVKSTWIFQKTTFGETFHELFWNLKIVPVFALVRIEFHQWLSEMNVFLRSVFHYYRYAFSWESLTIILHLGNFLSVCTNVCDLTIVITWLLRSKIGFWCWLFCKKYLLTEHSIWFRLTTLL